MARSRTVALIAGHPRRYPPRPTRNLCDGAMSGGAERGETVHSAAPECQIPRMTRDHGPPDGHRAPRGGT